MEKYGVWIDDSHTKTGSRNKSCPKCGSNKVVYGTVPKCQTCGTQPWEKRANEQKKERNWRRRLR